MSRIECPACFSVNKEHKYTINGYKINTCNNCLSLYVENVPPQSELLAQYKKNDYYTLSIDAEQRINTENARRSGILKEFVNAGKVLDIGCAKGSFLDVMKEYNFNTFGIEMSLQNVEICNAKGHNVYLGDLNSYYNSNAKQQFDIIACLDVIEHIPEPNEFLNKIKSLLSINGMLVLSTPNFSGIVSRLLGKKDPFLIPPEHINFLSKKGLTKLVTTSGFNIIQTKTFGYLTEDGLERTVTKYLPHLLHPFSGMIKPLLDYSVRSLNFFKSGLEMEFYLRKI